MQKKHCHYKLIQNAENIKASAILSYLGSFQQQDKREDEWKWCILDLLILIVCLFVCF